LFQDTTDTRVAQLTTTTPSLWASFARLSPTGALLLISCLVLVVVVIGSIALSATMWAPTFTHLLSFLAVRPYPWGCTGGSTLC
jgi:hypothetical protein